MGHTVAIGLSSICTISGHHTQETPGVEYRTQSAYCIDFHGAEGRGKKNETVGNNNIKSLA